MTERVKTGAVMGRFQPFHNGHLDYVLAARMRCEFLIVGITNPDPSVTAPHASNPHRSLSSSNPFTYYERSMIIRDSLLEAGLRHEEFMIVPFPINKPELIAFYVPLDTTFYVTIYDDWGKEKRDTIKSLGARVEVLSEHTARPGEAEGREIRRRMSCGEAWESLVPTPAVQVIRSMKLDERLKGQHG